MNKVEVEVEVYATGMAYCSVCADGALDGGDVAKKVEEENPAGTEHGWGIAEQDFATGEATRTLARMTRGGGTGCSFASEKRV